MASGKTVIVTGASQGIGAAIVQAFLERGYNVVGTSRSISKAGYSPSGHDQHRQHHFHERVSLRRGRPLAIPFRRRTYRSKRS